MPRPIRDGADAVGQVVDAVENGGRAARGVGEEAADAVDADEPARGDAGFYLLVGDVALVVLDGARVGVAEDHRAQAQPHDVEAGAMTCVRAVHQDARRMDRLDDAPAERGQRNVLVVAAAADAVVAVVGEVDLADAEVPKDKNHLGALAEGDAALEIERHRQLSFSLGAQHIRDTLGRDEEVGVGEQLGAEARDHRQDLTQRVHVHADVDRDEGDAGREVPLQDREVGVGMKRHAGVGIPDQGVLVEPGGGALGGHVACGPRRWSTRKLDGEDDRVERGPELQAPRVEPADGSTGPSDRHPGRERGSAEGHFAGATAVVVGGGKRCWSSIHCATDSARSLLPSSLRCMSVR